MHCPLLVPCDAEHPLDPALASGADVLIFDLGPGGLQAGRGAARDRAVRFLRRAGALTGRPMLAVRVAALTSGLIDGDLDAAMAGAPDAVVLPGAVGGPDIQHLAAKLAVREAEAHVPAGRTRIFAMAADRASGVLALGTLPGASPRLAALCWDPRALAETICGEAQRALAPVETARDLLVLTAAAAGVPAIDAPSSAECGSLASAVDASRRHGFDGKMALHPGQVRTILSCLSPSAG